MSTIGDPFLLSAYSHPRRKRNDTQKSTQSSNVFASFNIASSSKLDGFVTVAAAADGVQVLDLSSLHPIVSYTLGPQSSFSCPAVTRNVARDQTSVYTTYAVIEAANDVAVEDGGRIVWVWSQDSSQDSLSNPTGQKRSGTVPHRVSCIYAPEDVPGYAILVGPGCEMTSVDEDLQVKWTFTLPEEGRLLKSFEFSRRQCSFVPARISTSQGSIILLLYLSADILRVRVVGVNANGSLFIIGDHALSLEIQETSGISCSNNGFLTILTSNGVWYSFQLEGLDNLPQSVSPQTEPITLRSLTFISPPSTSESLAPPPRPSGEVSILSLGSSHVLIAAVSSGASPELTLLLWDLQYGVLLTSHTFAIPSTLPRNREQGIEITLAGGSPKNSQVILILSPPQLRASTEANLPSGKSTSSVLVVPITVPPTSTLANAMGRATAGAKWIAPSTLTSGTAPTQSSSPTLPDVDPTQAKLLKNLSMAFSQNRIAVAEEAFFKWVTNEETQRSAVNTKKTKYVKKMEAMDEEEKEWDARMSFGYGFVKAVLGMIFKEEKEGKHEKKSKTGEKGEGYSPKVVRFLLDEGLVCDGMVESGLLGALVARKDWDSALLALRSVTDISENDLVIFLHTIIVLHRSKSPNSDDAMQVDVEPSSSNSLSTPSLPTALSLCITYPTSAPSLRLALRTHLKEVEEIDSLFEVLLGWLDKWCEKEEKFLPDDVENNEHGVPIPIGIQSSDGEDLPPLDKILSFLQTLIDTSYLTLLTHPPSYAHLDHLNYTILPYLLSLTGDLQLLSGPLQPFVKAHSKALADASQAASGGKGKEPVVDWRKRRKAAFEQAGVVGLYQIEELVL